MDRNFFRRVEACFPIRDSALAERVYREGIAVYLDDNTHAWELLSNGTYRQLKSRSKPYSAQVALLESLTE